MQISEPAEYGILGLLQTRPMHGYEIFQQFERGALGQIVHLEMSQMYAFLKKLERLHYIEAQLEVQGNRPARKVFRLTSPGHNAFFSWLSQPVEKPRDIRILFLIKLYFTRRFLSEQVGELITRQIQACQLFLARLQARKQRVEELPLSPSAQEDIAFLDQVVLSARIHQTHSLLTWLYELQEMYT
jgi:PadR family transcriptional regulator, regulatory protein AphA